MNIGELKFLEKENAEHMKIIEATQASLHWEIPSIKW
jgi:hypothetical protein